MKNEFDALNRFSFRRREGLVVPAQIAGATILGGVVIAGIDQIQALIRGATPILTERFGRCTPNESREVAGGESPFESLLEHSLEIYLPDSRTKRDNILNGYEVTTHFLGGAFQYTGEKTDFYGEEADRIHGFAQIGSKSGYLDREEKGQDMWKTTTLVKTINTLLEIESLSAEEIKQWIVWMYQRSFKVNLEPALLRIERQGNKTVTAVFYKAEGDFNSDIKVRVARIMHNRAASRPGGNMSASYEIQRIRDAKGHLLLPSGLSPMHDIPVPSRLLKKNPTFDFNLNGFGSWNKVPAAVVAERINGMKKRVAERGDLLQEGVAFGKKFPFKLIAPALNRGDPYIKGLVDALLSGIDLQDHSTRIIRIATFTQNLPYVTEYDTDMDRPGLLTIFNGGGDCNNVSDLFCELMLAAGYDCALMHHETQARDWVAHVMGGIPAMYFPLAQSIPASNDPHARRYVAIELTMKGAQPGVPELGEDKGSIIFHTEELFAE